MRRLAYNSPITMNRITATSIDPLAMTVTIRSNHPAKAAIAAVLAFSATPLIAQTIAPPDAAPVTAQQPVAPPAPAPAPTPDAVTPSVTVPAAAPVMAPASPMVQPTASVEERRAAAIAQSEAEAEVAPAKPALAKRATEATAPVKAAVRDRASQVRAEAPVVEASATPSAMQAPVDPAPVSEEFATPVIAPSPVAAVPANVPALADASNDSLTWGLAGGALLVAGLAGAMALRRKRTDEGAPVPSQTRIETVPVNAPRPTVTPAPVAAGQRAPASVGTRSAMPLMHTAAVSASTPDTGNSALEALVAARPSTQNPFLTRRNRLRRANFLLRQRDGAQASPQVRSAPAQSAQQPAVDRSQMVYSYGPGSPTRRGLKPRTS